MKEGIELVVAYQLGGKAQSDGPGGDDTRQNLSRPGVILKEKGKIITLLINLELGLLKC